MAIAKVKKVELIAHISDKENILKSVEQAAILQVKVKEEILNPEQISNHLQQCSALIAQRLHKVNFLLHLIEKFNSPKRSLIDSFVSPKVVVKQREFDQILQSYSLDVLYQDMENADVTLKFDEASLKELISNHQALTPWKNLDFDPQVTQTKSTFINLGAVAATEENVFLAKLSEELPLTHCRTINRSEGLAYLAILVDKQVQEEFLQLIKQFEFSLIKLPPVFGSVSSTLNDLDKKIKGLQGSQEKLVGQISALAKYEKKLLISKEYLESRQLKLETEEKLLHTGWAFVLEGWLKAADVDKFANIVKDFTNSYSLEFSDPGQDENPPVILENSRWLKPFEAVTALYGLPSHNELDPTPFMAPFFLIFFGMAIGDVIYGLALALACWFFKRSSRFGKNTKQFFDLFIYGGISSMFFGVITGSWLTLDMSFLPPVLKKLIIFDPATQPTLFLVITLILGLIQIYFGLILKLVSEIREQGLLRGLMSQLPVLLFLPGAVLLVAKLLGTPLSSTLNMIAVDLAVVGAASIVLFSGVGAKGIFAHIGSGLYNLYGTSSFIGDTISYARIMALGLATFLIGSSINNIILGDTIIKTLFLKVLLGILILPLFHIFNLAINTIGAFVHPARLQYIEFFSKFFEGGGNKFEPFAVKTDSVLLE